MDFLIFFNGQNVFILTNGFSMNGRQLSNKTLDQTELRGDNTTNFRDLTFDGRDVSIGGSFFQSDDIGFMVGHGRRFGFERGFRGGEERVVGGNSKNKQ